MTIKDGDWRSLTKPRSTLFEKLQNSSRNKIPKKWSNSWQNQQLIPKIWIDFTLKKNPKNWSNSWQNRQLIPKIWIDFTLENPLYQIREKLYFFEQCASQPGENNKLSVPPEGQGLLKVYWNLAWFGGIHILSQQWTEPKGRLLSAPGLKGAALSLPQKNATGARAPISK